jgi:integrase
LRVPEDTVKRAFAWLIGESYVPKDWGGERSDLYTSRVFAVASPAQVSSLLDAVAWIRPEMTAFFGCLYYAALRPEEAVALRYADCHLPGSGWGMLRLGAASPRTAAAWTGNGTSHEQRGLKHRPDGAIRMVPVPPVLVAMLRAHFTAYGTAPDGRLFRGTRGGPLSESLYGRAWHAAARSPSGPS